MKCGTSHTNTTPQAHGVMHARLHSDILYKSRVWLPESSGWKPEGNQQGSPSTSQPGWSQPLRQAEGQRAENKKQRQIEGEGEGGGDKRKVSTKVQQSEEEVAK